MDQRRKAYDVFPQVVVTDEFMRRVENSHQWTLVDPYEVKQKLGFELAELWGDKFDAAYRQIEESLDKEITLYKHVNARHLFKEIMKSTIETGMPYIAFKDTINRANPNQHEGYIPGVNLCCESFSNVVPSRYAHSCLVAGTRVLTNKGYKPIERCDNKEIYVPFSSDTTFEGGASFRKATLLDQGMRQTFLVILSNGAQFEATGDHKIVVIDYLEDGNCRWWAKVGGLKEGVTVEIHVPFEDRLTTAKVVYIKSTGVKQVYDLSLPTGHNYVAEGVIHHNCNLDSINLANVAEEEIPDVCEIAVRLLDNTIDITTAPFEEAKAHNNRYRTIGVGAMGLADWLAKRKLSYKDTLYIGNLFENIGYYCTRASADLARERGAYPAFEGSQWSKGLLIGSKSPEWFAENTTAAVPSTGEERWQKLSADIQKYGIRNSHITAIAPNTSSSLVQGCTASILPAYSKFFYDKWAKGTVPIAPPFIADAFWFYQENKSMDQKVVVKAVAEMQKWIDTGISMELIFNLNQGVYFADEPERSLTAKDIFETLLLSWKEGCKAIYYIRTVQKDNFKEGGEGCVSCAN